jgi:hypothetical protein
VRRARARDDAVDATERAGDKRGSSLRRRPPRRDDDTYGDNAPPPPPPLLRRDGVWCGERDERLDFVVAALRERERDRARLRLRLVLLLRRFDSCAST